MISYVEHLFMCLSVTCITSLEKFLFRSSAHFKYSFFSFLEVELYELCVCFQYQSPMVISFANISHSVGCLLILFMDSFSLNKLLILCDSIGLVLLEETSKKILLRSMPKRLLLMFSSRSFMVSETIIV